MKKESIVIYTSYLEKFQRLTAAQFGALIRSLLEYQETGKTPEIDDPLVAIAYDCAKVEVDANNERYEQTSQLLSDAGKRGAEKRWGKPTQKIANNGEAITSIAQNGEAINEIASNGVYSVKDKEKDNDNDNNVKRNTKKKGAGWVESEELNQAIKNFIEHRKLMKKPMTAHAIDLFIKKLQKLAPTEAQQIALINKSIEKGWLDVYADDKSTDPPKAPSGKLAELEQYYLKGGK